MLKSTKIDMGPDSKSTWFFLLISERSGSAQETRSNVGLTNRKWHSDYTAAGKVHGMKQKKWTPRKVGEEGIKIIICQ